MNRNNLWLALILSLLVVVPFNWYFGVTSLVVVFINMITKFSLYFIGILSALYLIQYLKQKSDYEKQIIELLKEIKESKKKDNL
ncbi:hypothetical protein [Bacillus pseudomycoides]|uniref:hypothetical protein n=1 Tax=Bacillus pseudomycoides TaxID=64104 RepID=UPI002E1D1AFC|nr:hypothetical protein [Bacillus pseudomycoides]